MNTIFRDGPTGDLYIGGQWYSDIDNVPYTQNLARLPYGSNGPWQAVVNEANGCPYDIVNKIFRDGPTGDLYIGGRWDNNLSGIPYTKS